jgi:diguanylate cyclase (GGDEF)-like protein
MGPTQPADADSELQQLRQEVDRLRRQAYADEQRIAALEAELAREPLAAAAPRSTDLIDGDALEEAFRVEQSRAKRGRAALSLVLIEADQRDDPAGRLDPDPAIAYELLARTLQASIRPTDRVARVSSQMLALLLPATALDQALAAATRLQRAVVPAAEDAAFAPTFSAGVVQWRHDEALTELLMRAERALVQAKGGGPNRTVAG